MEEFNHENFPYWPDPKSQLKHILSSAPEDKFLSLRSLYDFWKGIGPGHAFRSLDEENVVNKLDYDLGCFYYDSFTNLFDVIDIFYDEQDHGEELITDSILLTVVNNEPKLRLSRSECPDWKLLSYNDKKLVKECLLVKSFHYAERMNRISEDMGIIELRGLNIDLDSLEDYILDLEFKQMAIQEGICILNEELSPTNKYW